MGDRSLAFGQYVAGLRSLILLLLSLVSIAASPLRAHEVTPAIGDFTIAQGQITLKLRMNVEAFVAGINLDGVTDTNQTAQSADYDELRALAPQELQPMVQLFAEDWLKTLTVEATDLVPMTLTTLDIPQVGDASLPRVSTLELSGPIPASASSLRISWPAGAGGMVLRQNGVQDPYTGYLQGGETSPVIALEGGSARQPLEAFVEYIPVGFTHILPKGLDHILFVLGLFFLTPRLRPLLVQVSLFTVAHTITLALGALEMVTINAGVVEPLIALSIVFVAVENIFARRLHSWRGLVIFGFGLLHGLGFASVLGEFGLPDSQFLPALIGFNVGVELGQLAVIAAAYLTVRLWFGRHPKYRGRVAIPASVTIAMIGGYWFVERVFL